MDRQIREMTKVEVSFVESGCRLILGKRLVIRACGLQGKDGKQHQITED